MPISFASTPLPANGQPRTAASEAAVFNNIANTYNAYESSNNASIASINAILAARSSTSAPSYIAVRDSNADIAFRDTYGRSFIGTGSLTMGAAARQLNDAATGLILPGALPVHPSYLVDGLNPSASATALRLDYAAGYTTDVSGGAHAVAAGNKVFNDVPSPTIQANWCTIFAYKATGIVSFVYAAATDSITPSTTVPLNTKPIADVYLPINAAGVLVPKAAWIGGTQPFFLDARVREAAITPGVGGGLSITDYVLGLGPIGDDSNAIDIYNLFIPTVHGGTGGGVTNTRNKGLLRVSPYMIGYHDPATYVNSPTMANLLYTSAGGMEQRPQDFWTFTANSHAITLRAGATVVFPGDGIARYNPANKVRTPSSGVGAGYSVWAIIADCAGFTNDDQFDFHIDNALSYTLTATTRLIGWAVNNGSGFTGISWAAFDNLLQVSSSQMVPIQESYQSSGATALTVSSTSTPQAITAAQWTLQFPRTMRVEVEGAIRVAATTTGVCWGYITLDGILIGMLATMGTSQPSGWDITVPLGGNIGDSSSTLRGTPAGMGIGKHDLQVWVGFGTAGVFFTVQSLWWKSKQWGVFS